MDLHDVVGTFDNDPIYDAYTGQFLFQGRATPHDDKTSSGSTVRRRTLITVPGTVAPARRAIRWHGTFWVVGNVNDDTFQGDLIRRSYGLKKSTGQVELLTPGQAARGLAGPLFHVHQEYFRDVADARTSADWDTMWNVYCPLNEPVVKGMFLRRFNRLMRVRNVYEGVDEYLVAEADQLDVDALQPATFTRAGKVNPVTDKQETVSVETTVVQTDMNKHYEFRIALDSDIKPGDKMLFVAQSAFTPTTGDQLAMMGAKWRVITSLLTRDAWALHVRRV